MRQMAAPSGRPPRPGPAGKGRKAGGDVRPLPITRPRSYAAIDLGTNNCRLLIARPQNGEMVVLDAFSRVLRPGGGLHGRGGSEERSVGKARVGPCRSGWWPYH